MLSRLGVGALLELIEKYSGVVQAITSREAAIRALLTISVGFGFRSGLVIVLSSDRQSAIAESIDTDSARHQASFDLVSLVGLAPGMDLIDEVMGLDIIQQRGNDHVPPGHPYRPFLEKYDLVDVTAVPISLHQHSAGMVCYCGTPELSTVQLRGLHAISYSLFARLRALAVDASQSRSIANHKPLTPRELQVMQLTARGLTANEIAETLGMSARTVNQHADNVADKLGTRNRTHTIAELVREGVVSLEDSVPL